MSRPTGGSGGFRPTPPSGNNRPTGNSSGGRPTGASSGGRPTGGAGGFRPTPPSGSRPTGGSSGSTPSGGRPTGVSAPPAGPLLVRRTVRPAVHRELRSPRATDREAALRSAVIRETTRRSTGDHRPLRVADDTPLRRDLPSVREATGQITAAGISS